MDKICSHCNTTKSLEEFHRCATGINGRHEWCKECRRAYSVRIDEAWEVVEKFKDFNWKLESHGEGETFTIYKDATHYSADGTTAPLAICRAALKAVQNG